MKNATRTFAVFFVILLIIPCSYSINAVKADTLGPPNVLYYPRSVSSDKFEIFSPQDLAFNKSAILLNFTVQVDHAIYDVGYAIDNGPIQKVENLSKISEEPAPNLQTPPYIRVTYLATLLVQNLTNGNHTLTIYHGFQYYGVDTRYSISGFVESKFSIEAPSVEILPIENRSDSLDVPITFLTSESPSWIGYSLDNQANVSITGNTTLTRLTEGTHSLVIYANDTTGNMGVSNMIYFTVESSIERLFSEKTNIVLIVMGVFLALAAVFVVIHRKKALKDWPKK
jgi:hypothetical protein